MAAKDEATIIAENQTLVTAIEALNTSLQAELDTYGVAEGDGTLRADYEEALKSAIACLTKDDLYWTGWLSQMAGRHGVIS